MIDGIKVARGNGDAKSNTGNCLLWLLVNVRIIETLKVYLALLGFHASDRSLFVAIIEYINLFIVYIDFLIWEYY